MTNSSTGVNRDEIAARFDNGNNLGRPELATKDFNSLVVSLLSIISSTGLKGLNYHQSLDKITTVDAMISLPGLFLTTGNESIMKSLLIEESKQVREGQLPMSLSQPTSDSLERSSEATLWLLEAIATYIASTGDQSILQEVLTPMVLAIDRQIANKNNDIGLDPSDGLLSLKREDLSFRKPIRLNALWYACLRNLETWLKTAGWSDQKVAGMADKSAISFREKFWVAESGYLARDANQLNPGNPDMDQLFALALTQPLLHGKLARSVVSHVRTSLLTPYGLRRGNSVLPWMLAPFVAAHFHSYGSINSIERLLDALIQTPSCTRHHLRKSLPLNPPLKPSGANQSLYLPSIASILRADQLLSSPQKLI